MYVNNRVDRLMKELQNCSVSIDRSIMKKRAAKKMFRNLRSAALMKWDFWDICEPYQIQYATNMKRPAAVTPSLTPLKQQAAAGSSSTQCSSPSVAG